MKSSELVAKLKDIATNYKTLYVMGCFGAPMNDTNKKRYTSNHDYNKKPERTAMINAASSDTFGFDCVCLIKGVLWGWNGDKSKVYGGATYVSNGVPDIGADSIIGVCSNVSTDFSSLVPGELVWMSGHVGIYIGDGLAVECSPAWANKVQITACNCSKSGYNRRNWTKHGKLPYVTYDTAETAGGSKTESTVKGIDVSKWQGEIDWKKVKSAGIKFAMVRLGYGSANGTECGTDGYFEKNVTGAISAGVDIGCYFYSYALSVEAAKKEAEYVISVLAKYKGAFTYPIAFDIEDSSQQSLGKETLTDMVIAFGDAIEKAGYYCSVYANLNWFKNVLDDTRLTRFDHWLAQWASAPTYTGTFGIWQSSSTGNVDGINGNVDTDVAYKDYPTVIKGKKLNGFTNADQKPAAPSTGGDKPSTPATPDAGTGSTSLKFKVGDIVNFAGGTHYSSSNATSGSSVKGGKAKITQTYNGKHPYHCRAVNDAGAYVSGVYGWVDENTLTAISTGQSATGSVEAGDLVKIVGTTYYSGTAIPSWVKAKNWYVREVKGDRAVIDKSEDGENAICSPIKISAIAVVKKAAQAAAPWTPAVGDIVNYSGSVHYSSANAASGVSCKGGQAKITQIYQLGKSKHPYHLIHTGSGCTVYG